MSLLGAPGGVPVDVNEFVGDGWIWKETPPDFSPRTYRTREFTITRFLEDREVIDLGGRALEVSRTLAAVPGVVLASGVREIAGCGLEWESVDGTVRLGSRTQATRVPVAPS